MTSQGTDIPLQGELGDVPTTEEASGSAALKSIPPTWLMEKLADIEHERWCDWQAWCHQILRENCPSPELEKVLERWDRQISTPYSQLTEKEKQSDRDQVMRYWPLIQEWGTDLRLERPDTEVQA